ncbi:MAG: hypothetical protein J6B77_09075 [Clostridia bacterium]|nr:hypothetical protein [Clostridia bacterium]
MRTFKRVLWGTVLILLGVLFILDLFNIWDIGNLFFEGWWTLFIIVPCTIGLITERDKIGNLCGIFLGVGLLFAVNDYLSFALFWKLFACVCLILVGLKLIFGNLFRRKEEKARRKIKEKLGGRRKATGGPTEEYCATFSAQHIDFSGKPFYGAELTAVFGSIDLDLTNAVISEDALITVSSIFGGISVKVPKNVVVCTAISSVFGGVDDETEEAKAEDGTHHTIYIDGNAVFGGVEIK